MVTPPRETIKAVQRLGSQDEADIVLPPYSTGLNLAAAPIYNRFGLPMVTSTATTDQADQLSQQFPNVFFTLGGLMLANAAAFAGLACSFEYSAAPPAADEPDDVRRSLLRESASGPLARRSPNPACTRAHPRSRRQPHTKDGGRGFSALRGLEWCTAFSNPRPSCPGPVPRERARVRGAHLVCPIVEAEKLRRQRRRDICARRSACARRGVGQRAARAACRQRRRRRRARAALARECLQPGDRLGIGFAPGELGGSRWWSMCRGRKQPTTTAHMGAVASRL